ncbi:hypothetical protein SUGI_0736780 [Cryptomeria japonica]|uniref:MYB-like transcription factor 4 n=1 Tax=Cryptomeria japonica TaxID=3369 RepID=UPI002414C9AA|nr:MYB-like transcription factor 4 [Cryptomeria japonica]GLJ36625.1 hypothetical protein SUGI_0736780 [Cryptomeria japonica]
MGRTPCCGKVGVNRGPWTPEEDLRLKDYIQAHGKGRWAYLSRKAGLLRSGKSCRMRWLNYLQPDVKRGRILPDEEDLILRLHRLLGNRWSLIAGRLPGRSDNDIKNHWNIHLSKKLISQGIDPRTHRPLAESEDIWWTPQDTDVDQNVLQNSITPESANQEIHSDFIIADHKEEQICSSEPTPAISCFQSAPTILSSASEIVGYSEMSNSNCFETSNHIKYSSRFPYSLPATPRVEIASGNTTSFLQSLVLNEEFEVPDPTVEYNYVSKLCPNQPELVSPSYDLWSRLQSPSTHHYPSR